jgi:glycosyltransferase involved in cell wall biosynthesis
MHKPRFSILVPVYNVQKYLEACVESILHQDFSDYELILINDGSTDESGRMCDTYPRRRPNVSVFHQENLGSLQTRRRLIQRAQGEFILFVDSDDYLRGDALAVLDKAITHSGVDMVIFLFTRVYLTGEERVEESFFTSTRVFEGEGLKQLRATVVSTDRLNSLCRKVIRRQVLQSDIDYKPFGRLQQGEDLLLSLHPLDRAQRVLYLQDALYFYRYNPTSITRSYDPRRWSDHERVSEVVERYVAKWDVPAAALQAHYLRYAKASVGWVIWAFSNSMSFAEQQKIVHSIREHRFVLKLIDKFDPRSAAWNDRLLWTLFRNRQFTLLRLIVLAWDRVWRPARSLIRRS